MTQALILVGGQGTRLRPLTCNTPKAMVPVLNIPFLEHVIRNLKNHGIVDMIFAQHHLPELMAHYFGNGKRLGVNITYVMEDAPRGTAGAIKNAEEFFDETFFVLNGDIFHNRNFTDMLRFHRNHNAKATIVLTPVEDPTIYGVVETDNNNRVKRFLEKPKHEEITTNMINAGTYVLEPNVLNMIPAGVKCSIEREIFPEILADGQPVYGYNAMNYWMDTGTPEKYLQLHRDLLAGRCDGYTFGKDVTAGKGTRAYKSLQYKGKVFIGENCTIGVGAQLTGPVVLGNHCRIGDGAVITDSVLWDNVTVGAKVEVHTSAIANDCSIGTGSHLRDAVIGDHLSVPANSSLEKGARVYPEGHNT